MKSELEWVRSVTFLYLIKREQPVSRERRKELQDQVGYDRAYSGGGYFHPTGGALEHGPGGDRLTQVGEDWLAEAEQVIREHRDSVEV